MKSKIKIDELDLEPCHPRVLWAYFKSENMGYICLCLYLFFEYVRPQTIYPVIAIVPWTMMFLMLAFLGSFSARNKKKVNSSPLDLYMIAYLIIILLSSATAFWPSISFNKIGLYGTWVIVYFAVVRNITNEKRFFFFLLIYLLFNFKMSQHGFISWASRGFSYTRWGVTGAPGYFQNSGEFGIQLTIFIPLAMAFIYAYKDKWNLWAKLFFYLMPFTAIGSVMATTSRGAMMGVVGSVIWHLKSTPKFIKSALLITIAGMIIWNFTPAEFKERFETAGDDKTSTHRLDRWEKGWETMLNYPVLGVGHKNFELYFSKTYSDVSQEGSLMIHNMFLQSGTEHGFLGLGILLLLIIKMLSMMRTIKKQNTSKQSYYIAAGLSASVIGMIISASFITVLYYPYVWVHAAMTSAFYNVYFDDNRVKKRPRKKRLLPTNQPGQGYNDSSTGMT